MYHIYTDGSCLSNGKSENSGGYGIVVVKGDKVLHTFSKSCVNTTNNREEMKAILAALLWIEDKEAIIYSDSAYALNTFTTWMYSWANRGWIKSDNKIPENLDIVKVVYDIMDNGFRRNIKFVKVKGHAGNVYNEIADGLATGNSSKVTRLLETLDN